MNDDATLELLRRHFGEGTAFEPRLFGGWHIIMSSGSEVVFTGERFEYFIGGSDVYRAAVSAGKELWGTIAVDGPPHHILTVLAHGVEQNVQVQPTIENKDSEWVKILFVAALVLTSYWIASSFVSSNEAWGIAAMITVGIMMLINKAWDDAERREARRRGQHYCDAFPQVHAQDRRTADLDEVRKRGLV